MEIINNNNSEQIVAITVKGSGKDENGLTNYVWATKKQLSRLLEAQFDDIERNFVFQLGDYGVRPCDILTFKIISLDKAKELPAFRGYVLDALEKEKRGKLGSSQFSNLLNK